MKQEFQLNMICANANYISGSGSNSKRKWDHDEYWYE